MGSDAIPYQGRCGAGGDVGSERLVLADRRGSGDDVGMERVCEENGLTGGCRLRGTTHASRGIQGVMDEETGISGVN